MTLDIRTLELLRESLAHLDAGFAHLPTFDATPNDQEIRSMRGVLKEVAERLRDNYPYAHPFYAGQMLKPPHPVARLAYALAQHVNPNNHALDGGRASSAMEKECVAQLARMVGWTEHLGHLTGGGTIANLEALWVAERTRPGGVIVASAQAHYTHSRMCDVLGLAFEALPTDRHGRLSVSALEERLERGGVGTVVVTLGTTATGSVDPLRDVLRLHGKYSFRTHVDAAYGGYFGLADNLGSDARAAFDVMAEADSIAIDPHKHGLQPYGTGCVLFRDTAVGAYYKHDSPYTYFSSAELHLGEISLECSRPGAAAVALWATQRLLPLERGGKFARGLADCRGAALELFARLEKDSRVRTAFSPELDIVIWAPRAETASATSSRSRAIFEAAARSNLHLAVANLPRGLLESWWPDLTWDREHVTVLRSCLIKAEHRAWLPAIWAVLDPVLNTHTDR
ncbi:MAG: aspartate aminotransferase family protein [Planctomycetes bacterium]|nr:aspartate aminotransferase family protein [Planctomycetota bacterium]